MHLMMMSIIFCFCFVSAYVYRFVLVSVGLYEYVVRVGYFIMKLYYLTLCSCGKVNWELID